jgi:hypothetical protein
MKINLSKAEKRIWENVFAACLVDNKRLQVEEEVRVKFAFNDACAAILNLRNFACGSLQTEFVHEVHNFPEEDY